jgi:hypothetical protein
MPYTGEDALIQTTHYFEIEYANNESVDPIEFNKFITQLRRILDKISSSANGKDIGSYSLEEIVNGQSFFPDLASGRILPRQVYRIVINFGTLPNAGTTNVAHGITFPPTNTVKFTRIYGTTNDLTAGSYLPLPYSSTVLANNIELSVDNTNVSITTGINRTSYTETYIVLEYIKA